MASHTRKAKTRKPVESRQVLPRPRRPGPRRVVSVSLCPEHARYLRTRAAEEDTTEAEIVMDLIEEKARRMGTPVIGIAQTEQSERGEESEAA